MRGLFLSAFLMFNVFTIVKAQSNVDYLIYRGDTTPVNIVEVGSKLVKFNYLDTDAIFTRNKLQIDKIIFASGREQEFNRIVTEVNGLYDAPNIYITFVPEEVDGLYAKGELFSKAVGVTIWSAINSVNNRSLRKLKAEAAMLGANVVFLGNTYLRGNQPGATSMSVMTGTGYNTEEITLDEVLAVTEDKEFLPFMETRLNRNAWSPNTYNPLVDASRKWNMLTFTDFYVEDGKVKINTTDIERTSNRIFEVVNVDKDGFITLMYRTDKKIFNYIFIDKEHKFAQAYLERREKMAK